MRAVILLVLVARSAGFIVPSANRAPRALAVTPKGLVASRVAAPEMVVDSIMSKAIAGVLRAQWVQSLLRASRLSPSRL